MLTRLGCALSHDHNVCLLGLEDEFSCRSKTFSYVCTLVELTQASQVFRPWAESLRDLLYTAHDSLGFSKQISVL